MRRILLKVFGLVVCLWTIPPGEISAQVINTPDTIQAAPADTLRFLAVGDINLGRKLGRIILKGDTTYPFAYVTDTLKKYDVVFANLESTIERNPSRSAGLHGVHERKT